MFSYVHIHLLVSSTLTSFARLTSISPAVPRTPCTFCARVYLFGPAFACVSVWQNKGVGGWVCSYCKVISQAVKKANNVLLSLVV